MVWQHDTSLWTSCIVRKYEIISWFSTIHKNTFNNELFLNYGISFQQLLIARVNNIEESVLLQYGLIKVIKYDIWLQYYCNTFERCQ